MSGFMPAIKFGSNLDGALVDKALKCKKMGAWLDRLSPDFNVEELFIDSIDLFGQHVGFVKFQAKVTCKGVFVPGIVFMRGESVAVLIILSLNGEKFILCTKQARFPVGDSGLLEIVAGMVDEDGNVLGAAAKELKEEANISVNVGELINLGFMYPSPGGSDERILLYAYEMIIDQEQFDQLQGAATGNIKEGESITLQTIPYNDGYDLSDSKALSALLRYEKRAFC